MHIPVLKEELLNYMNINPAGTYVDCTGGGGGHAMAVAEKLDTGRLIVLDRDPEAVARLREKFISDSRITVMQSNFRDVLSVLSSLGLDEVDGLCADFGVSSFQLIQAERGFSFRKDGLLDMRMNPDDPESAADIVNKYSKEHIGEILLRYGEEKFYKRISDHIVSRRMIKPFTTTLDLANVVKGAVPMKFHKPGMHPATQTFQAIRIHVNQELVAIEYLMREALFCVRKGGRVAFISFHSLEDRLVKEALNRHANPCKCPPDFPVCICGKTPEFKVLTKKPVTPGEAEIKANPLSRSAKLRSAERI